MHNIEENIQIFDGDIKNEEIKKRLDFLTVDELKNLIRKHYLDPLYKTSKWKDKDKLIMFILETRKNLVLKFGKIV